MKKTIYFLSIFILLAGCTGGNQKTGNNENGDQQTVGTVTEENVYIAYSQSPLAYLIEGVLYFHNFDTNEKVKFAEEPEPIINFVFDTEGNTLYYSVRRDSSLWLKSANVSESKVETQWVTDWELKEDNELEYRYSKSLFYHKGELLIEHDFHIGFYMFRKFDIYNIADHNKITRELEDDGDLIEKFKPLVSNDNSYEYFKTKREELYYTGNNESICLTDKLDIKGLKTQEDIDDGIKTEFYNYIISPDETKILFRILLGDNEETFHGPYCITNIDGSKQMIVEETESIGPNLPVWLKDNRVVFIDYDQILYVANNEDSSVLKIAENVSSYVAR